MMNQTENATQISLNPATTDGVPASIMETLFSLGADDIKLLTKPGQTSIHLVTKLSNEPMSLVEMTPSL